MKSLFDKLKFWQRASQSTEENNGIPVEIPVELNRPESLEDRMRRLISEMSKKAQQLEMETEEDFNDFDLGEEDDDLYPEDDYEGDFKTEIPKQDIEEPKSPAPVSADPSGSVDGEGGKQGA